MSDLPVPVTTDDDAPPVILEGPRGERTATQKQEIFLNVLFTQADGDLEKAAEIAGYTYPAQAAYKLVKTLQKEITKLAELYLAKHGPAAARALVQSMENPTEIATNIKMNAATQILDRIGVVKKEQLTVNSDAPIGIFILPPKDKRSAEGTATSEAE